MAEGGIAYGRLLRVKRVVGTSRSTLLDAKVRARLCISLALAGNSHVGEPDLALIVPITVVVVGDEVQLQGIDAN